MCQGSVKRAIKILSCNIATLLQNELNSDVARFTTHIKPVFQQIGLLTGFSEVLKRATLLFNSFCSNLAKESYTFLLPVLRKLFFLMKSAVSVFTLESVFKSYVFCHTFSRISADRRQIHKKNVFKKYVCLNPRPKRCLLKRSCCCFDLIGNVDYESNSCISFLIFFSRTSSL